jgi:hypothetical protein
VSRATARARATRLRRRSSSGDELRRIRDELDYVLATRGDDELRREEIEPFFERSQQVWRQTSTRWLDQRRRGEAIQ